MSAQTKADLDEAITAHLQSEYDTDGMLCTGYALIAAGSTAQDFDSEVTRYLAEYADRQPFHASLGLVHRHLLILEHGSEGDEA